MGNKSNPEYEAFEEWCAKPGVIPPSPGLGLDPWRAWEKRAELAAADREAMDKLREAVRVIHSRWYSIRGVSTKLIDEAYALAFPPVKEPVPKPEPCLHPRCEWYKDGGYWLAHEEKEGKWAVDQCVKAKYCHDCGAKLEAPPMEEPSPDAPCGYVYRGDERGRRGTGAPMGHGAGMGCPFIRDAHTPEASHDWIPVPEVKADPRDAEIEGLRNERDEAWANVHSACKERDELRAALKIWEVAAVDLEKENTDLKATIRTLAGLAGKV